MSTVTTLARIAGVPPRIVCATSTLTRRTAGQRSTRGSASGSTTIPHGTIAMATSRAWRGTDSRFRSAPARTAATIADPPATTPAVTAWPLVHSAAPIAVTTAPPAPSASANDPGPGISQT